MYKDLGVRERCSHLGLVRVTSASMAAMSEAGADGFAGLGVGGVAEELAVGGVDEGVAAVEDGERRERLQAGGGVVEAGGADGDGGDGRGGRGTAGARPGGGGRGRGGRMGSGGRARWRGWRVVRAGARRRRVAADSRRWRRSSRRWPRRPMRVCNAVLDLRDGERGEALAREHELIADGAADAGVEGLDALLDAVLGGGDEFGGGGGRGRAQVGDEVRDGEVGLVADGGDDGERGRGDGAGEGFVVEAGEVFDGAAAAGDEDEVDAGPGCALNQRMPAMTEAAACRGPAWWRDRRAG